MQSILNNLWYERQHKLKKKEQISYNKYQCYNLLR